MLGNIFSLLAPFVYNRVNYTMMHSIHCKQYIQKFSCIFSSRDDLCEKWRNRTFVKLGRQKLFLFSRKSNFRILGIQVSWRHQIPKHKARNAFYWITLEVNTVCKQNLVSLCHIIKEKIVSKTSRKTAISKVSGPLEQPLLENKIFEASYLY